VNYDQAVKLVIDALKEGIDESMEDSKKYILEQASEETRLFGGGGILDSLGVVILLSDLEEKLDDEYDVMTSLASDSTMSKTRSPFRNIKSLANYIVEIVEEAKE
jgi:acyl carrier protein